ncbi:hypothetical protein FRB96_002839 [Tulasnella sp. 330]|nr:hypothetical protein FRB96_002839 [Tulasnella sp. 330]
MASSNAGGYLRSSVFDAAFEIGLVDSNVAQWLQDDGDVKATTAARNNSLTSTSGQTSSSSSGHGHASGNATSSLESEFSRNTRATSLIHSEDSSSRSSHASTTVKNTTPPRPTAASPFSKSNPAIYRMVHGNHTNPSESRGQVTSTFSVSTSNSTSIASSVTDPTTTSNFSTRSPKKLRRARGDESERGDIPTTAERPAFLDAPPPADKPQLGKSSTSFFGRLRSKSRGRAQPATGAVVDGPELRQMPSMTSLVEKRVEDFEERASGAMTDSGNERHSRSSSRARVGRKKSGRGGEDSVHEPLPTLPSTFSVAPQLEPLLPNDRQSKGLFGSMEQFGVVMDPTDTSSTSAKANKPPSSFHYATLPSSSSAPTRQASLIRTTGSGPRVAAQYRSIIDRPKPQTRTSGFFVNRERGLGQSATARSAVGGTTTPRIRMKVSDRVALLRAADGGGSGGSSVVRKGSLVRNGSLNRKSGVGGSLVRRNPSVRDGRGAKARLASAAAQAERQAQMKAGEDGASGKVSFSSSRPSTDTEDATSSENGSKEQSIGREPTVIEEEVEVEEEDESKLEPRKSEERDALTALKTSMQETPTVSPPSMPEPVEITPSSRGPAPPPSRPLPAAPAPASESSSSTKHPPKSVSALINQIQNQIQTQAPSSSFSRLAQQSTPHIASLSPSKSASGLSLHIPSSSRPGTAERPGTPGSMGRRQAIPRSPLKPPTSPLPPTPVSSASTITPMSTASLSKSTSQNLSPDPLTPPSSAVPSTGQLAAPVSPLSPRRSDWFDDSPNAVQTQFADDVESVLQPQPIVVAPLKKRSKSPPTPAPALPLPPVPTPRQSLIINLDRLSVIAAPTLDVSTEQPREIHGTASKSSRPSSKVYASPPAMPQSVAEAASTSTGQSDVSRRATPALQVPETSTKLTFASLDVPDAAFRLSAFTSAEELDAQITQLLKLSPPLPVPASPKPPTPSPPPVTSQPGASRPDSSVLGASMTKSSTLPLPTTAEKGLKPAKSFDTLRPAVEIPPTINRSASATASAKTSPETETVVQAANSGTRRKPFAGATPGWSMVAKSNALKTSKSAVFSSPSPDGGLDTSAQVQQAPPPSTWQPGRLPTETQQRRRSNTAESRQMGSSSRASEESVVSQPKSTTVSRAPSIVRSTAPSPVQRVMASNSRPASPSMRGKENPFPVRPRLQSNASQVPTHEQSALAYMTSISVRKASPEIEDRHEEPSSSRSLASQFTNSIRPSSPQSGSDQSHGSSILRVLVTPTPLGTSARASRTSRVTTDWNSSDEEDRSALDDIVGGYDDDSEDEADQTMPRPGQGLAFIAARLGQETGRGGETSHRPPVETPERYQAPSTSITRARSASSASSTSPLRRRPTLPPGPPPVTPISPIGSSVVRTTSTMRRKALGAGAGGSQWI